MTKIEKCDEQWGYCRVHKNANQLVNKYCETYVDAMHEELHKTLYRLATRPRSSYDLRSDEEYVIDECPFCEEEE